ncbi:hypothetical protein MON38_19190 [Hymenobacter sp. DH14]|uniref:DUF4178 domain-containing protein n=1 Tax=Hymenobacter cyanobacteriorum TaxID=2926463 RepID=A0A9X1VI15_9BACT|nr:hypothetical protein [Hymenobacter cyanobacteriorum]MCI1189554.1 hypothetical protein [Hymenobacter cyanobacteriorum]
MKIPFALSVLALVLLGGATAQAQPDGPRQLGGAPSVPTAPRPRPVPAPRQLDSTPVAPPDSTRRATITAPLSAPMPSAPPAPAAPVYAPAPAGQLPGGSLRPTRFQVGLKNGLVYSANDVETKNPLFGHSYLLLDGQRKFELAEVGFYEDETGHYVRTTLPNSSREATLRREKTGRISLYSITTTQYSSPGGFGYPGYGYGYGGYGMGGFGYPYGGYRTVKTEYFSKDNGPIQNLTSSNLLMATRDNAGAQQLLFDSRRYQHITTASYVVGGGLLVAGLLQTLSPTRAGISPLTFAALPVLLIPVVLQSKQAANQRQAIALYNATQ